jgi:hypothetical protein
MAVTDHQTLTDQLRRVAQRRILFGHQSVGSNVLEGLERLALANHAASLHIAALGPPSDGPAIAHVLIGANGRPFSKIAHFDQLMSSAAGRWAEIAFFKFCYVDFHAGSDLATLFDSYQQAHEARQAEHPQTIFVHMTAPLTTVRPESRRWFKNPGSGGATGERENMKRNEYNQLLRRAYEGSEPLFDLARIETAAGRGSFERDGRRYECLDEAMTSDGGHLNATGQLAVASTLVNFLAALPGGKP